MRFIPVYLQIYEYHSVEIERKLRQKTRHKVESALEMQHFLPLLSIYGYKIVTNVRQTPNNGRTTFHR
jgi:hypothetical protein